MNRFAELSSASLDKTVEMAKLLKRKHFTKFIISPSSSFHQVHHFTKFISTMIYLAADHAGFALKEKLKVYLGELGHEVTDFGAFKIDQDDDYPDFIRLAAEAVSKNPDTTKAIILGGSGQGEAMVANRHKGVRAVVYYGGDEKIISLSREHNSANVLSLGARFINEEEAKSVVKLWLETKFNKEERHVRRIGKIDAK